MDKQENGGGYGYAGADAQSAQQQSAQTESAPSADYVQVDADATARPNALNGQSQIAYDAEEE